MGERGDIVGLGLNYRQLQKPRKKFLGIKNRIFGNKKQKKNYIENEEIRKLSIKQKELHNNIQSCKNKIKRVLLKAERNRYLNDLHSLKAQIEEEKLQYQISEIERLKDDSRRMFSALKYVNSRRRKS